MPAVTLYYSIFFLISFVFTVIYIFNWQKHFDVNITAIFLIIPVVNLFYLFMYSWGDVSAVVIALKVIYIGGCFLPWFIFMCISSLCKIQIKRWLRTATFLVSAIMYLCVLTVGYFPIFYKSLKCERVNGVNVIIKEYAFMHTFFYVFVLIIFAVDFSLIFYTYKMKSQVSRRLLRLLILPPVITVICYFLAHFTGDSYELIPITYCVAQFVYLLIIQQISLYDVSDMVIETMVQAGDTGFITFDFKHHYLGSNETAKNIIPSLRTLKIDESIFGVEGLEKNVVHWLRHFEKDNSVTRNLYVKKTPEGEDDQIFVVNVDYLYDGRKKRGYQVFLSDDTKNQKYIRLIDSYNEQLEAEVDAKTERIIEMHDNLIMSMATMVESRDNSTGGHIRRTSVNVKLLIKEMLKDEECTLSDKFCKDIVKAAPMHDLGKIAVKDAILCKPGRFTDEEFEQMKAHAAEGARIVHEILKDTDDEEFKIIAENVAHYHHERMDGTGYPEGLKGDEIPLEARIMAIADVYDALVSKRVYKERMSFEKADSIIMEGMGTQFDKNLEKYYVAARPKLEEFYKNEDEH